MELFLFFRWKAHETSNGQAVRLREVDLPMGQNIRHPKISNCSRSLAAPGMGETSPDGQATKRTGQQALGWSLQKTHFNSFPSKPLNR
jgi:hypothetical protein